MAEHAAAWFAKHLSGSEATAPASASTSAASTDKPKEREKEKKENKTEHAPGKQPSAHGSSDI